MGCCLSSRYHHVTVSATDFNLLTQYHSISLTDIEAARTARNDNQAIQNSKALYHCLRSTLGGDIKATLFDQIGSHTTNEDGAQLFKTITDFSLASSLQLTIKTITDIQALDPVDFKFSIAAINTKLTHYFILASSSTRALSEAEKLQHTLTVYAKIKQPESWAQWIRTNIDAFNDNSLTVCQTLMNAAALKHLKISSEDGVFCGRSTSVSKDVVAMLATHNSKPKPTLADSKSKPKAAKPPGTASNSDLKLPPLSRFTTLPRAREVLTSYKVGDFKMLEGRKFHFCDAPNHWLRHKWHGHTAESCRSRKIWMQANPPPAAHAADASDAGRTPDVTSPPSTASVPTVSPAITPPANITVLLANCLQHAGDNPVLQALIGDALNQAETDL
jgi:hypothetical protein